MKWFLIGSVCLLCSAGWVRGDAAADLYNQGVAALQDQKYDAAAQAFDKIITGYPSTPNIDEVRIRAGYAYLYAGKFPEAMDRLSKEAADNAKPEFRPTALYFTAQAQFSEGEKNLEKKDKDQANTAFTAAVTTLSTLIDLVTTAPTPDNKGYLEQSIYYRALSYYEQDDYDNAEKDLLQLIQQFPASLSRPDYLLRLGNLYEVETNQAVTDKKTPAEVEALADKALKTFDRVSTDPNALVQANDANMIKAEVLFMIAQIDSTPAGYEKALEAFRKVLRKDDMVPLQQKRLDEMRRKAQDAARANAGNALKSMGSDNSLLIQREENRLKDLQNGPDPIIQALIRMGECYVAMKQPDEARTILHRLIAHAKLTADQQKDVDFQILYSYVLGGQTDKADKALTDYLGKHAGDPNADSMSYQIAAELMKRKDFAGALKQAERSLKDFPKGKYADDAIGLQAQALTRLGRIPESNAVVDNFLKANPASPKANNLLLTRAQNETSDRNFAAALADYQKVRDNAAAGPDLQAAAAAGYIQTLNSLKKYDDVITESKAFAVKYPTATKMLPSVMLFAALAMDQKHDPGAVAALQDIARKYPKDDVAPFALSFVVNIYQRANNVPGMIQAANDLRKAYPTAYVFLLQAADAVSTVLIKQKKFDDAIALYQPLIDTSKPEVAASVRNKIAAIWLVAASKGLGYYQSMSLDMRKEAEKRLASAEQAYLGTLKTFPAQLDAVGDAFDGLAATAKQRRSWGLLKDPDLEGYLGKVGADLTTPEMQARLEMAKAGLVFVIKNGVAQYPAALDRFKKVIAANPGLRLTRQETDQFGDLLLAAHDYPTALKIYGDLLDNAAANDPVAHGDAYYGLGATYLGQGDLAQAKKNFLKLKALPSGGAWQPHILDANYGIALADEQSSQPADIDEARQIYAALMQAPQGGVVLQSKAMLGYGRLLEKSGNAIKPTPAGPNEYGVHYYQEPHTLYGPAVLELSAEGLFDAGQAYEKAGDKANAKKQYDDLLKNYGPTARTPAPDWAAKAQAAQAKLGP